MVAFIGPEAREHSRFVEKSVEHLQDALTNAHVASRLGETAQLLLGMSESLYIPNIHNGEIKIPESKVESDSIPIIAMFPWNAVTRDPNLAVFTPSRYSRTLQMLSDMDLEDFNAPARLHRYQEIMIKRAQEYTRKVRIFGARATQITLAGTFPVVVGHDKNRRSSSVNLLPRSLVVLRRRFSPTRPSVIGHEIMHVEQDNRNPVFLTGLESTQRRNYRKEAEAFTVGANISKGMLEAGHRLTKADHINIAIADTVSKYPNKGEDPFAPHPYALEDLSELELLDLLWYAEKW